MSLIDTKTENPLYSMDQTNKENVIIVYCQQAKLLLIIAIDESWYLCSLTDKFHTCVDGSPVEDHKLTPLFHDSTIKTSNLNEKETLFDLKVDKPDLPKENLNHKYDTMFKTTVRLNTHDFEVANGSQFIIIGSNPGHGHVKTTELHIQPRMVSSQHALLVFVHNQYHVVCLNATNGTEFNDIRLNPKISQEIQSGAVVKLGGMKTVKYGETSTEKNIKTEYWFSLKIEENGKRKRDEELDEWLAKHYKENPNQNETLEEWRERN